MTARKNTPTAYEDVKYVLSLAIARPGLKYECDTVGQAVHFKQRCNLYRMLLRTQAKEVAGDTPGFRPEISYDLLVISQTDIDGKPDRQGRYLVFKHQTPLGKITDPETGEEITFELGQTIIRDGK